MIDAENLVYSTVATALREQFSGLFVAGEYVTTPARFPAVTLVEVDNRVLERMRTLNIENAAAVTYELNVYSNKTSGKKAEAKSIVNYADSLFTAMGFTRTMREQVPNLADSTIYRIVARYEAVLTVNDTGDEFTIYQG